MLTPVFVDTSEGRALVADSLKPDVIFERVITTKQDAPKDENKAKSQKDTEPSDDKQKSRTTNVKLNTDAKDKINVETKRGGLIKQVHRHKFVENDHIFKINYNF